MLANRIKNLRRSIGLNQIEFAKALNVTQSAVSHWETGRSNPDTHQLLRIAKYFGITVDELTKGIEVFVDPPNQEETDIETENIEYSRSTNSNTETHIKQQILNGTNRETPLDAPPDQLGLEYRLHRLPPERRKQALDYIKFLEMQDEEE